MGLVSIANSQQDVFILLCFAVSSVKETPSELKISFQWENEPNVNLQLFGGENFLNFCNFTGSHSAQQQL